MDGGAGIGGAGGGVGGGAGSGTRRGGGRRPSGRHGRRVECHAGVPGVAAVARQRPVDRRPQARDRVQRRRMVLEPTAPDRQHRQRPMGLGGDGRLGAGAFGTVLHFAGDQWSGTTALVDADFGPVHGKNANDVWFAGGLGALAHWKEPRSRWCRPDTEHVLWAVGGIAAGRLALCREQHRALERLADAGDPGAPDSAATTAGEQRVGRMVRPARGASITGTGPRTLRPSPNPRTRSPMRRSGGPRRRTCGRSDRAYRSAAWTTVRGPGRSRFRRASSSPSAAAARTTSGPSGTAARRSTMTAPAGRPARQADQRGAHRRLQRGPEQRLAGRHRRRASDRVRGDGGSWSSAFGPTSEATVKAIWSAGAGGGEAWAADGTPGLQHLGGRDLVDGDPEIQPMGERRLGRGAGRRLGGGRWRVHCPLGRLRLRPYALARHADPDRDHGTAGDDVWAVGELGAVRWNGTAWYGEEHHLKDRSSASP